jgi:pimeloyl-ACP methyl ester carboxylesterase
MVGHEGRMRWAGHETWYRVVGELDGESERTPVVICHGGPGGSHDYCEPIAELHAFGRTCVLAQLRPDRRRSEAFLDRVETFLRTID